MKSNDWQADAERLAALLDDKLSTAEREKVLAQLAGSPDDLAVLADATAALRESNDEGRTTPRGPAKHARRWWRPPPRSWLAIAAVAAGVSVLPVILVRGRGGDDPARFVRLLGNRGAGIPTGFDVRPWGVSRTSGVVASPAAIGWRLGARLTDLELAVAAGDTTAAMLAGDIADLLAEIPAAGAASEGYRRVAEAARGQGSQVAASLGAARISLNGVGDAELINLGAWVEAARIAAVNRDSRFFDAAASKQMLDRLNSRTDVTPNVRATASRLRADVSDPSRIDWVRLTEDLTALLAGAAR